MTKELKNEILNLLNDAYYWKESTSEHKKRINAVYKQLTIPVIVRTLVCVDSTIPNLTEGKKYTILAETNRHYNVIDDNSNDVLIGKSYMRELKQAN